MTREEREAIREKYRQYLERNYDVEYHAEHKDYISDIGNLLDALAAETERVDEYEAVLNSFHNDCGDIDADKVLVYVPSNEIIKTQAQELSDIKSDRDKWKVRAEALERAIKDNDINSLDAPYTVACMTCAKYDCDYSWHCGDERKNWQFDEARFAEGDDTSKNENPQQYTESIMQELARFVANGVKPVEDFAEMTALSLTDAPLSKVVLAEDASDDPTVTRRLGDVYTHRRGGNCGRLVQAGGRREPRR